MSKLNKIVFKLFGKMVKGNTVISFEVANKQTMPLGFIMPSDLCSNENVSILTDEKDKYRNTFYKTWNSITEKTRFELFLDQIKHYSSTYGTNFTSKFIYVGDSDIELELPEVEKLKVIEEISEQEVIDRSINMFKSGIALGQETINDLIYILKSLNYDFKSLDINSIKNKEVSCILCELMNTQPNSPIELLRFLVYKATKKTLLIKSHSFLDELKRNVYSIKLEKFINEKNIIELSTIFYRYKPFFLAFKTNRENNRIVNKLRKLANKHHIPYIKSLSERILSEIETIDFSTIQTDIDTFSNSKKIRLMQSILFRLNNNKDRLFVIRNKKSFFKQNDEMYQLKNDLYNSKYMELYFLLEKSLTESLKNKSCKVFIPKGLNITLPSSEKSFIGNFPIGTSIDFSKENAIIGIFWGENSGAYDLDLSLVDINNQKIGWNSHYTNKEKTIIYSGDMTNPNSTELMYAAKGFYPSILKVNLYGGTIGSKFKIFVATENITSMKRNYMVNPNNIIAEAEVEMSANEKSFGFLSEDRFVFAEFNKGSKSVSSNKGDSSTQFVLNNANSYISLQDILVKSNFELVETSEQSDLDLSKPAKDSLLNLIS